MKVHLKLQLLHFLKGMLSLSDLCEGPFDCLDSSLSVCRRGALDLRLGCLLCELGVADLLW